MRNNCFSWVQYNGLTNPIDDIIIPVRGPDAVRGMQTYPTKQRVPRKAICVASDVLGRRCSESVYDLDAP